MKKLNGSFTIIHWDETPYQQGDAKQALAHVRQTYEGAINGSSEIRYLIAYQSDNQSTFVGFETLEGEIDGQQGSMVLQHAGTFSNGVVQGEFTIVPDSAKGDWVGLQGRGSIESSEHGKALYQLELLASSR